MSMPDTGSKFKGREGEQYAEAYLQGQGLLLVERNYRCRFGEIDLIMREGKIVVFIEVRMRASQAFGGGSEQHHSIQAGKIDAYGETLSRLAKVDSRVPIRCGFVVRGQGGRNGMDKKRLLRKRLSRLPDWRLQVRSMRDEVCLLEARECSDYLMSVRFSDRAP